MEVNNTSIRKITVTHEDGTVEEIASGIVGRLRRNDDGEVCDLSLDCLEVPTDDLMLFLRGIANIYVRMCRADLLDDDGEDE